MPKLRKAVIAGAATLALAGIAAAATAKMHTMQVGLPDGSVAHVTYEGDVAPKVVVQPAVRPAAAAHGPLPVMDREFAAMEQRHAEVMRQVQAQVAATRQQGGQARQISGQVVVSGNSPAGSSYSYTMVSASNGQGSCSQTVEMRSDGSGKQPQVTRASSGDCGTVKSGERDKPAPAAAPAKARHVDPRSI